MAKPNSGGPGYAIDETNLSTRSWKEFITYNGPYGSGLEAFNALSPIPVEPIMLDADRELAITKWNVIGDDDILGGADHLNIHIEGFIRLKKEKRDELSAQQRKETEAAREKHHEEKIDAPFCPIGGQTEKDSI